MEGQGTTEIPLSQGIKYDQGKARLDLFPYDVISEIVDLGYSSLNILGCGYSSMNILGLVARWWRRELSDGVLLEAMAAIRDLHNEHYDMNESIDFIYRHAALYGEKKYASWGWSKGMAYSRCYNAFLRHMRPIVGMGNGSEAWEDEESGLPHTSHAMCCLVYLASFSVWGIGVDDRPHGAVIGRQES